MLHLMSRSPRKQLADQLAHSVRHSFASVILFNQKVADEIGVNLRDLQVLHLLQLRGPSTPRDLARWACVTTGGTTGTGFVELIGTLAFNASTTNRANAS